MVGLRYGFHPRVTDVISRTSEVKASESRVDKTISQKKNMRLFIYHIPTLSKMSSCTYFTLIHS